MTKAPQSLKTQKSPKTPRTPKPRHKGQEKIYPRVVYARVTDQEWSTIQLRSDQAGLSMSRYLVEAGLREKPPVTLAERARLQFLLYQFHRAATCINQVATDRLVIAVGGSDTRQLLQEVFALLEQLAQELIRRIEETNSHDTKRMP